MSKLHLSEATLKCMMIKLETGPSESTEPSLLP